MMYYTKEDLIRHLRYIYKDRGEKIPGTIHLRLYKGPQYEVYVKTFGSWNLALEEAGFKITMRGFKKWKENKSKKQR